MRARKRGGGPKQAFTGLLMMAAGVVLLLDQQGVIEIGSIGRYWPLLLVVLGLWKVLAPREERDVAGGAMLVVFGSWILACTHQWLGLTYWNSWPLVFVAIGVRMIIGALIPAPLARVAAPDEEARHA